MNMLKIDWLNLVNLSKYLFIKEITIASEMKTFSTRHVLYKRNPFFLYQ